MNQFGSNYDADAILDCCCEFDVDSIIDHLEGPHVVKELCSGTSEEYTLEIRRDSTLSDAIIISNFNNTNQELSAIWDPSGEFRLQKDWSSAQCEVTVTGSLHRNIGKLHIIYAAIPPGTCDTYSAKTCETRGL